MKVLSALAATAAVGGVLAAPAAALDAPEHLTVEQTVRPNDVDVERPRLAWRLPAKPGAEQRAYEVEVATSAAALAAGEADAWQSGRVPSRQSIEIPYGGRTLASDRSYVWRVRVWDEQGAVSPWSAPSRFETAFLKQSDWRGDWIGRGDSAPQLLESATPAPQFRKQFTLPAAVRRARLRISGLGYNEVELNGEKVGDHVLDPAWTAYDKTALYESFDVTDALRNGDNALGVTLGRGYLSIPYAAGDAFPWVVAPWISEQKLLLQLDVELADGTRRRIVSDDAWKVADSAIVRDSVNLGEVHDARLEQPGWSEPGFDDSGWDDAVVVSSPTTRLRAQLMPPVRVTETLQPVRVGEPSTGVRVYDFGTMTAGWSRLRVKGAAGTTIRLLHGERLNADGTVASRGDIHGAASEAQVDSYTLRGGDAEVWEPRFVYHGFRYVQVSVAGGGPLPPTVSVEARVAHNDLADNGGFASSNTLYERFNDAMRRTILNNAHGIPTDTPTFDKAGWTADAHLYSDSALRNLDAATFFAKWLDDVADAQKPNGEVGVVVPALSVFDDRIPIDPLWSNAYMLVAWDLYRYEGDKELLQRHYEGMKRLLDRTVALTDATGGIWESFSFGDWVPPTGHGGFLPREGWRLSATGGVIEMARTFAEIARVLGQKGDATAADAVAARIGARFNAEFLDREAGVYRTPNADGGYRQTAQLQALALGLVPEDLRGRVLDNLVADIGAKGDHLDVGATGAKLILPLLTDAGYGDLADTIASKTTFPSWGYMLDGLGNDTFLETWDGVTRSLDHPFLGTVDDWLTTHLAGIRPAAPGYAETLVQPFVPSGLDRASAWVDTPYGRVSSAWERAGEGVALRVEVPGNTTAEVRLPAADATAAHVEAGGATLLRHEDGAAVYAVGPGLHRLRSDRLQPAPPLPPAPPTPPAPPGPGGGQPKPPAPRRPALRPPVIAKGTLKLGAKRVVPVRVRCDVSDGKLCRATITIRRGRARIARKTVALVPNRLTTVRVGVGASAAKTLARARRSRVTVTLSTRGVDGRTRRATVTTWLVAARR